MATRKRKGVTGLAAVGIVAITLAGLWAWFLPAHRPTLRVGEELGLDAAEPEWLFWQFSDQARVDGIETKVDLNVSAR